MRKSTPSGRDTRMPQRANAIEIPDQPEQSEERKKPRKRWSLDTGFVHLPAPKSAASSSSSNRDEKRPVPAPRTKLKREKNVNHDTHPLIYSEDEILEIQAEDGSDGSTGNVAIEMTSVRNASREFHEASPRLFSARTETRETVLTIEHSSDTGDDLEEEEPTTNRRDSTVVLIEQSDDSDRDDRSYTIDTSNRIVAISSIEKQKSVVAASPLKARPFAEKIEQMSEMEENGSGETYVLSPLRRSSEEVTEAGDESSATRTDMEVPKPRRTRKRTKQKSSSCFSSEETESRTGDRDRPATSVQKSRETSREKIKQRDRKERTHSRSLETRREEPTSSSVGTQKSATDSSSEARNEKRKRYVSVTIHKATRLEFDVSMRQPIVRVHVVYAATGEYPGTRKQRKKKREGKEGNSILAPMSTRKFDVLESGSRTPIWEDELIFKYDYDALKRTDDRRIVLLFEIIESDSVESKYDDSNGFSKFRKPKRYAWAFLRPAGNRLNTDKKVKLQLYKYEDDAGASERVCRSSSQCQIYSQYTKSTKTTYDGKLYVTVTAADKSKFEFLQSSSNTREAIVQRCKIPNDKLFETDISENGYSSVAFSHNGKYLAYISSTRRDYSIVVQEVASREIYFRCKKCPDFLHSLSWSADDKYLLCVSSNRKVYVSNVHRRNSNFSYSLLHTEPVNCGKFDPEDSTIVATASTDGIIRVWLLSRSTKDSKLIQDLRHEAPVNSLCFFKDSNLLSADEIGQIILWTPRSETEETKSRKEWQMSRRILCEEIRSSPINIVLVHLILQNDRTNSILVHTKDNRLRLLHLETGRKLRDYNVTSAMLRRCNRLPKKRELSTVCISPCGNLIFCADEDTSLDVWDFNTSKHLAKYSVDSTCGAVKCVAYHPTENILAFATFGSPAPLRLLKYNENATGEEVGLKLTSNDVDPADEITSFFDSIPSENSISSLNIFDAFVRAYVMARVDYPVGTRLLSRFVESLKDQPVVFDPVRHCLENKRDDADADKIKSENSLRSTVFDRRSSAASHRSSEDSRCKETQ